MILAIVVIAAGVLYVLATLTDSMKGNLWPNQKKSAPVAKPQPSAKAKIFHLNARR